MTITREHILLWLKRLVKTYEENRERLTQLDAAVGDADHGINMDRGFRKVSEKLPGLENRDIGGILRETGMTLIASVGGASGPLYGTFFIKASEGAAGRDSLDARTFAAIVKNGVEALKARGKAQRGDKTMVDALEPAARSLEDEADKGGSPAECLRSAVRSAEEGMKATVPLAAKRGRASYLGERSVGHQDPGATSSYLMIKALGDVIGGGGGRSSGGKPGVFRRMAWSVS
jgi:phosphoenolpyruvate---glycerone phosphotransferase subunit DhaL